MADPQMQEFYGRLKRVDRIHRRGGGFEAPGTLGRSYYTARPRRSLLRPLLLLVAGFMILKAVLLVQIGEADFQGRVATLNEGSQLEQIGAWALQMDPATIWLAEQMRGLTAH